MLEIMGVSKIYGKGQATVVALDDVSLTVNRGDSIAIMGPSGSGKSTLLNIIGGLDRLSRGEVHLEGERIDDLDENDLVSLRRGKISYVFQQYHLLPSLNALENVLLPIIFSGGADGRDKAADMLRRVGLEKRFKHKPGELSGGEQQRVAIARALVNGPSIILADEPTGNMDQKTGRQILDLLAEMNREGVTILLVTHDPEVAATTRETVFLRDGKIVERTLSRKHPEDARAIECPGK
ncbi:MAG: hypothetical protein A2Z29_02175 [Chloroflexi bacterium RBG_16_56_11]|nr:MAG: hypothetical protein A2Z29_02175 [Chloroflexi bacterium RBG_16_56_11]